MRTFQNILVTGGAGFIGSNFIREVLCHTDFKGRIINADKLTYAGNLLSLQDITQKFGEQRYIFEKADICDLPKMTTLLQKYNIDCVVHFAAESHVDRSIDGPKDFIQTNINGTFTLLEACRQAWQNRTDVLFHGISTDEVYGTLGDTGLFTETTPYDPHSPYSASKAASDHLIRAYHSTYGIPVTLSNCSNNYGPYHFPEKLIPLMILNLFEKKALPVYGEGQNVRDWLYVNDHAKGIWNIVTKGRVGESYNIGGLCEMKNIDVVKLLCEIVAQKTKEPVENYLKLITYVKDRPGHDWRYAIDCSKINNELGWQPTVTFAQGIEKTVDWYLQNSQWVDAVRSGEYRQWIDKNYALRT